MPLNRFKTALVLSLSVLVLACSSKPKDPLAGRWFFVDEASKDKAVVSITPSAQAENMYTVSMFLYPKGQKTPSKDPELSSVVNAPFLYIPEMRVLTFAPNGRVVSATSPETIWMELTSGTTLVVHVPGEQPIPMSRED